VDGGDLRRVTWIAGDQAVLIEEVIDTTRDRLAPSALDYVSLSHGPSFDREVWSAANQYPLTSGANRMILIRDAEKLTRWQQLIDWLSRTRTLPGVYLVFVSNEPDLPTHTVGGRKVLAPHAAALKAPRGSLVKCSPLNEADALAWVRRRSALDEATAKYLLTRTGGNLAAAAAVCTKLALFPQTAGAATINALVAESASTSFADELTALNKRAALRSIASLEETEVHRLIALLDARLDTLEKLHRMQVAGKSWREVTGINAFAMRQLLPHARHYDTASCVHRRRVLAVIDDALRNAARDGVLQALVALW
jgi:DNA polymerase III delta subunit